MNLEETKFMLMVGFQLVNALASTGLWIYMRYGDRNEKVDKKFDEIRREFDERMDQQDKTIARLSGIAERAPTHADLSQVYEKLNTTAQSVSAMAGEMKGMNETLRLILQRFTERGTQ